EAVFEQRFQSDAVVAVVEVVQAVAPNCLQAATEPARKGWKDLAAPLDVEVLELTPGKARAQSQAKDAAGRGSCDQIEVVSDGSASRVAALQLSQDRGRENSADATAIERQDAKPPVRWPSL